MRLLRTIPTLLLLFVVCTAAGQNKTIEAQKRAIAALEKKIAAEEREIAKLRKGRSTTEERARRLARQIDARTQLLEATENEAAALRAEIARADSTAGSLDAALGRNREQYAEMVREAYRNYHHSNYLTYLFAARDFTDAARRIALLREVAAQRARKMERIGELTAAVKHERELLDSRKRSLDSVSRSLAGQRKKLQNDAAAARREINSLSKKEKTALQRKLAQEEQLDAAIAALRKLTKGNKEGASFSAGTSGLRLPVAGGRVKRYKENMAEITGPKGAKALSIYEGKVVEIKRNRITGKYDVFVAHGEYITSYANLASVCVEKGRKVGRNEQIGTIGSAVDVNTMKTEYKLVFGIYAPDPARKLRAESCFRK